MNHYILRGKRAVTTDLMTWAEWFDKADRIVKQETLPNGLFISTVFLGVDHRFGMGKPLLFETMVFPSKEDFTALDMERYSTWGEAAKGHKRMVAKYAIQN